MEYPESEGRSLLADMMLVSGGEYGDVAPLVKGVAGLATAAGAVILAFRGRFKWEPPDDQLSGMAGKTAGVVVAAVLAALWFVLPDVEGSYILVKLLPWLGGSAVFFMLLYGFLVGSLTHRRRGLNDVVVGGLWKNPRTPFPGKKKPERLSGTDLIYSARNDPDAVWPPASRSLARQMLAGSYVLFIAGGAGTLTCAAAVVIARRMPRIEEFTIDPPRIRAGENAILRWKATNVEGVTLRQGEAAAVEAARSGEQPVTPTGSIAYTLEVNNSFGSRSAQRALLVAPQSSPPSRSRNSSPTPKRPGAVSLEARLCRLTQNVVVRGPGWLESEGSGVSEADCVVNLAAAGKYEIFVEYASGTSRPVRVLLNGNLVAENGLAAVTGGNEDLNLRDQTLGVREGIRGINTLQFHTEHGFPLIRRIRFEPI